MGLGEISRRSATSFGRSTRRAATQKVHRLAEKVVASAAAEPSHPDDTMLPPEESARATPPSEPLPTPKPEPEQATGPEPMATSAPEADPPAPGALQGLSGSGAQEALAGFATDQLVDEMLSRSEHAGPGMAVRMDAFGVMMPAHPGVEIEIPSPDAPIGGQGPALALRLAHQAERSFDNRFGRSYFQWAFATFPGDTVEGRVCVDLGCGSQNPFAMSMLYVLLGARRALAVDIDPPQDARFAAWGAARMASLLAVEPRLLVEEWPVTRAQVAQRLDGFDVARLWDGDLGGLDAARIAHAPTRAEELPLDDGEADFVQSTSFLEHVDDIDGVVAELARVIRPGGWTWHLVDGLDHRIYADPSVPSLGFLGEAADQALVHGCNRLRPLEYAPIFERHGFEAVTTYPYLHIPVDDAERASFVEPWRSMPDEVLSLRSAVMSFRRL